MNTGGLVELNSENGKSKKMKTTGKEPHPDTWGHTSHIKGNQMLVYGGFNVSYC